MLRRIADAGRTVVATVHQPSSEVLHLFDKVSLHPLLLQSALLRCVGYADDCWLCGLLWPSGLYGTSPLKRVVVFTDPSSITLLHLR